MDPLYPPNDPKLIAALKKRGFPRECETMYSWSLCRQAYEYALLNDDLELQNIIKETGDYSPDKDLIHLVENGDRRLITIFLTYGNIHPNQKALVTAAESGKVDIVETLIDFGADYSKLPSAGYLAQSIFVNCISNSLLKDSIMKSIREDVKKMLEYRPINPRRLLVGNQVGEPRFPQGPPPFGLRLGNQGSP